MSEAKTNINTFAAIEGRANPVPEGDKSFRLVLVSSDDPKVIEIRDMETDDGIFIKISEIPLLIAILKSVRQTL